jgi:hypothetical protein
MILRFCWRGLSPALPSIRFSERTRAGHVPASYPTASTRRLMGPAANARTDQMVYVDCREDFLNYKMQYRLWKIIRQQPIAELENEKLHQTGGELEKQLTLP